MGALTPDEQVAAGGGRASCLLSAPPRAAGQVCFWVWPNLLPSCPEDHEPVLVRSPFFTSTDLLSHSVSNHHLSSRQGRLGSALYRTDTIRASPVTRGLAGAAGRIEFACATDWLFTLGCSPPPLARTQLPLVSGFQTNPGKDFHLAGSLRSKAHECGGSTPLSFFRPDCCQHRRSKGSVTPGPRQERKRRRAAAIQSSFLTSPPIP